MVYYFRSESEVYIHRHVYGVDRCTL